MREINASGIAGAGMVINNFFVGGRKLKSGAILNLCFELIRSALFNDLINASAYFNFLVKVASAFLHS